jgi:DNA-binding response OmpR family regulator
MRVLIVDDDLDSAESLAALLSATGHEVRVEVGAPAGVARRRPASTTTS